MVTEWSHLLLMFCEITYVQLNLQALLCVLGLFLAVGTPFVFLLIDRKDLTYEDLNALNNKKTLQDGVLGGRWRRDGRKGLEETT